MFGFSEDSLPKLGQRALQRDKKIAEKGRKWFFSAIFYMHCNGNQLVRQLVNLVMDISNSKSCIYEQRFFRAQSK